MVITVSVSPFEASKLGIGKVRILQVLASRPENTLSLLLLRRRDRS